jgi:hypothetical protein
MWLVLPKQVLNHFHLLDGEAFLEDLQIFFEVLRRQLLCTDDAQLLHKDVLGRRHYRCVPACLSGQASAMTRDRWGRSWCGTYMA